MNDIVKIASPETPVDNRDGSKVFVYVPPEAHAGAANRHDGAFGRRLRPVCGLELFDLLGKAIRLVVV